MLTIMVTLLIRNDQKAVLVMFIPITQTSIPKGVPFMTLPADTGGSSCHPSCMLMGPVSIETTGQARLVRSHSSARFCFKLSGNSNYML